MDAPAGALPPDVAAALAKGEKDGQAIVLWVVGMFCIFVWDWIINLQPEIERVWKRKFTHITALYLANRYYGLVQFSVNVVLITIPITGALNVEQCARIFLWQPVGAMLTTIISQLIMGCRVYALYGKSKYILIGLGTALAIELAVHIYTLTVVFPAPPPAPGIAIPCAAVGPTGWLVAFWTLPLVYDTITFGLTLIKSVSLWRKDVSSRTLSNFFRDGLIYFAVIFIMNLINVILFVTQDNTLKVVNLAATLMLTILMSCRLILNVRAPQQPTTYSFNNYIAPAYSGMGDTSSLPAYQMRKMGSQGGVESQLESGVASLHRPVPVLITKTSTTTQEFETDSAHAPRRGPNGEEKAANWW